MRNVALIIEEKVKRRREYQCVDCPAWIKAGKRCPPCGSIHMEKANRNRTRKWHQRRAAETPSASSTP